MEEGSGWEMLCIGRHGGKFRLLLMAEFIN
jgi:hypothetical protein